MTAHLHPSSPAAKQASPLVSSYKPLVVASPGRGTDMELRVSAPSDGDVLPIIVFSHGNNESLHAYGPLVDYWVAHGFVVIQPAHLDSWALDLAQDDPRRPDFWRYREEDLVRVLDQLEVIEGKISAIQGRLDRKCIAVAGHSWGAGTASMLLGATHPDPERGREVNIVDARVKAGLLLSVAGTGGNNLSEFALENFPFMNPDFSRMDKPTLVIAGDKDVSPFSVRGPEWRREAYDLSPGRKALFTAFGAEHWLGGIHSYEFSNGDANRARVATICQLTTAFLHTALNINDSAWDDAVAASRMSITQQGCIEEK